MNCGNSCNTFDVYFNSSNCDREGQSYPVEYYLESVKEYSEGKIHMSEPGSGNGEVNVRNSEDPPQLTLTFRHVIM